MSSTEKKEELSSKNSSHSDQSVRQTDNTSEAKGSLWTKVSSHLPDWVNKNLTTPRSLKVLLRCWLGSWVAFIILLPHASLNTLGTAGFFAMLCSFFLPANMPVQLFLFVMFTLVVGLCLSWGIGVAAMRAANASRSAALLQAATARLQASIQSNPIFQASPSLAQTTAVFTGQFLDIRSSAVYGCFLGVSAFFFGLMRAYAPKLTFTSIFATIGIDVFCSIGPLFPTAQYLLLKSFIVSVACYTGIAIITTLFVFPETMSHSALRTICEQLEKVKTLIDAQDEVLRCDPEDLGPGKPLSGKLEGTKAVLAGTTKGLVTSSAFISLEFSWGKWSSDDVKDVVDPLASLVARSIGLQSFAKLVWRTKELELNAATEDSDNSPTSTMTHQTGSTSNDAYLLHQISSNNTRFESEHNLRITDVRPVIENATAELRKASVVAVESMRKTLDNVNRHRWTRNPDVDGALEKELDEAYESLREAQARFIESGRLRMVDPFRALFEGGMVGLSREEQDSLPLRSLFFAYVLGTNLVGVSEGILKTMDVVRTTVGKRKRNRLWAPKELRKIVKLMRERTEKEDVNGLGDDNDPEIEKRDEEEQKIYKLDPDSRPPTNVFQKVMNRLHSLYKWSKTPEAMFGFKYMFITIAIWLPAVVNRTAGFYYKQKGLWALIMAQTTLNIYAADQVFNLVVRLIGTVIGLVLGLAAWYMGNGHGLGNPYGAAAATGLVMLPLLFIRNFAPIQYTPGVILCCATFALIVGYSWVDGHIAQFATPGIGWSIAWKRFTLVVIGSAASFIVMMLPPTSGRTAVRLRNASTIESLSQLYAFLISTWISEDKHMVNGNDTDTDTDTDTDASADFASTRPSPKWLKEFRTRLLRVADETTALRPLTEMAKWEGSVRGKWPKEEYEKLVNTEAEMLTGLAQLGAALAHLDDDWRVAFMHNTRVLNPNFITEVMTVFSLISQSLRTGEPLHEVLPQSLVGRLLYHHYNHHHLHDVSSTRNLTLEAVTSLDYMYYATGIVAVFLILRSVDELQRITKRLCGEVPLKGFPNWREQFEREHTLV